MDREYVEGDGTLAFLFGLAVLQGAFVVLKLTHALAWSWLAVTAPVSITVCCALVIIAVACAVGALLDLMERISR